MAQTVKNPPALRETWVWSLSWEDPLEEGMATHSSILAWRIPMDRSLGSQRVGHDWVTKHTAHLILLGNSASDWCKCYRFRRMGREGALRTNCLEVGCFSSVASTWSVVTHPQLHVKLGSVLWQLRRTGSHPHAPSTFWVVGEVSLVCFYSVRPYIW